MDQMVQTCAIVGRHVYVDSFLFLYVGGKQQNIFLLFDISNDRFTSRGAQSRTRIHTGLGCNPMKF